MQRLLRKFETAKDLVPRPLQANAGKPTKYGVIYYGSTSPAMDEAIELLEARRPRARPAAGARLPVPFERDELHRRARFRFRRRAEPRRAAAHAVVNECNIDPVRLVPILHYDGTPITARFIAGAVADRLDALKVTPLRKVVS